MSDQLYPDVKVKFRVADGATDSETLWATSLGADRYILERSPYWVSGVSLEDVVLAPFEDSEGMPLFARVVLKSGNRTIRAAFEQPVADGNRSDQVLEGVVRLGCSYAFDAREKMATINILIGIELLTICAYLDKFGISWRLVDPGP